MNQTKPTDAAHSPPPEPISGEKTVVMDADQLVRLCAESKPPPPPPRPRDEQPTLQIKRQPRAPQG